jgi:hypothetical protein
MREREFFLALGEFGCNFWLIFSACRVTEEYEEEIAIDEQRGGDREEDSEEKWREKAAIGEANGEEETGDEDG